MISRYRRKPVTQILQVQTFVKDGSKHHPLPEDGDDSTSITAHDQAFESSSQKESSESGMSEDSSGPLIPASDAVSYKSSDQSYSGVSTDGSSVMSWGFDEYDQAATLRVQQLFREIDELLYEEIQSAHLKGLRQECQQWRTHFPHLRICGEQIVISADDGYGWYPSSPSSKTSDETNVSPIPEKDFTELNVFGTRVTFYRKIEKDVAPIGRTQSFDNVESAEEEGADDVIVSEGTMEEYLAFDCRDMEEELYDRNIALSFGRLKMGLPPISPFFCKKNALLSYVFDDVWREVVSCVEDLIRKYWEQSNADAEKGEVSFETAKAEPHSPLQQFEPLPLALPRVTPSKMQPATPNMCCTSLGDRKSKKKKSPSHATRQAASTGPQWNLNSIMMIQGISLQHRNLSPLDKSHDLDEMPQLRPSSGAMMSSRPWPGYPQDQSSSSLSHSAQAGRRRNPPRILQPIGSNPSSRAGTPRMDEVVRGTKLATQNDQLAASPVPFSRNNLLPPIGISSDLEHPSTPGSQRQTPDIQSRNIMDHSTQRLIRRGSPCSDSVIIEVTGISLGRSSSRMNSSPQNALDEEEKDDHLLLGVPLHSSVRTQGRGPPLTRSRHCL